MTKIFKFLGVILVLYVLAVFCLSFWFYFTHGMCNAFVLGGSVQNESSLCTPVNYVIVMPFKFIIGLIRGAGIMI